MGSWSVDLSLSPKSQTHATGDPVERSVNRVTGGLVFAGALVAGAIVYGTDPGFGGILMGASLVPLLWVLFASRARHPGMR